MLTSVKCYQNESTQQISVFCVVWNTLKPILPQIIYPNLIFYAFVLISVNCYQKESTQQISVLYVVWNTLKPISPQIIYPNLIFHSTKYRLHVLHLHVLAERREAIATNSVMRSVDVTAVSSIRKKMLCLRYFYVVLIFRNRPDAKDEMKRLFIQI